MNECEQNALKLENQLCFPLYACARVTIKLYKPYLDELGLTYTQYITMLVLWEKKSATVKELGQCLFLDSGTLTPLLKKMEAKGLLRRKRSEQDERSLTVTLTDDGEAMKDRAAHIPKELVKCLRIKPDEIRQLYITLYKMLGIEMDKTPF